MTQWMLNIPFGKATTSRNEAYVIQRRKHSMWLRILRTLTASKISTLDYTRRNKYLTNKKWNMEVLEVYSDGEDSDK